MKAGYACLTLSLAGIGGLFMTLGIAASPGVSADVAAAAPAASEGARSALSAALGRTDTLAFHAARAGILFGEGSYGGTWEPAPELAADSGEMSLVQPLGLGTHHTRVSNKTFDFSLADGQISLARKHAQAIAGGYLVVHGAEPSWITSSSSRADALRELQADVTAPIRYFAGQLQYWIVVNEAVVPWSRNPNHFRSCVWQQTVGDDLAAGSDYVTEAFRAARAADPSAQLVYNDYGMEGSDATSTQKRSEVLALLKALKDKNLIDGLGLQSHLSLADKFDPAVFTAFLDAVTALGLDIYVTELDVDDKAAPSDVAARDRDVAASYAAYLGVLLAHRGVKSIATWGISDKSSWLNRWNQFPQYRRADGLPQRPDLLDDKLARKPAYFAVIEALKAHAR